MQTIVVLDYFMNKHFTILNIPDESYQTFTHGDKISYLVEEKGTEKESIGMVILYPLKISEKRTGQFVKKLTSQECEEFIKQQEFALKVFPLFKKKFKQSFPWSKPISSRYNPIMDQLYFYFYSEERYVFSDFVRDFRQEIWKNIFLFQVGARDMMRLDPNAKTYAVGSDCGMEIACQGLGLLPSVEMETITMQGLEGRDTERLKGRCWKLKCSLLYELEIYAQEGKDFPHRGEKIQCPNSKQNGIVSSYNIITREVVIKTEDWGVLRVPLSLIKKTKEKSESCS